MKQRFAMEILNESPAFCGFAYFDTEEHLADILFADAEIDVEILREYGSEEDSYRVIECRIPKDQRASFLNCIDLLPQVMNYVGRTDYADYCREFLANMDKAAAGGSSVRAWMR